MRNNFCKKGTVYYPIMSLIWNFEAFTLFRREFAIVAIYAFFVCKIMVPRSQVLTNIMSGELVFSQSKIHFNFGTFITVI